MNGLTVGELSCLDREIINTVLLILDILLYFYDDKLLIHYSVSYLKERKFLVVGIILDVPGSVVIPTVNAFTADTSAVKLCYVQYLKCHLYFQNSLYYLTSLPTSRL